MYNPIFGTFVLSSCSNEKACSSQTVNSSSKPFIEAADGTELTYQPLHQRFGDCYGNIYTYNPKTKIFVSNNLDNISSLTLVDGTIVNYNNNYINFYPTTNLVLSSTIAILPNGTQIFYQQATSTFIDMSGKMVSYDPAIKNFNYSIITTSDKSFYRYDIKMGNFTYWWNGNQQGTVTALDGTLLTYDSDNTSLTYQKFIGGCSPNGIAFTYNPVKGIFMKNPINNKKSILLLDGTIVHYNSCEGTFSLEGCTNNIISPRALMIDGDLRYYNEGLKIFADDDTFSPLDYDPVQGTFS
jgi:hypothetical protein